MTPRTCCARAASYRSSSVSGKTGSSRGDRRRERISSASFVPPGSRVTRWGIPFFLRCTDSRRTWVVLPDPSIPSNVTNGALTPLAFREPARAALEASLLHFDLAAAVGAGAARDLQDSGAGGIRRRGRGEGGACRGFGEAGEH